MASSNQKQSRRDQILQALAHMLETSPGQRITTARLAAEVGVSEGDDAVVYCGSGIHACHTLAAMEVAGLDAGRLFPGSWSQWSADPTRPAVIGDRPHAST